MEFYLFDMVKLGQTVIYNCSYHTTSLIRISFLSAPKMYNKTTLKLNLNFFAATSNCYLKLNQQVLNFIMSLKKKISKNKILKITIKIY